MALIDQTIGFHADALALRARRSEVLASNLANAETPGFQARDIDFAKTLRGLERRHESGDGLVRTNAAHLAGSERARGSAPPELLYRQPSQPSADGNTVEPHMEKAAFMENAAGYEATLRFLEGRLSSLMTALRGDSQ